MKYGLRFDQKNKGYLNECDEIIIPYNKNFDELKLIADYPYKQFVIEIPYFVDDVDWKRLDNFNKMCQNRLVIEISDIDDVSLCKQYGLKFFYGFPSSTFEELNALKALGVSYFKVAAPLFFQLPDVKKLGVPVRMTANKSRWNDIISTGMFGTWIRPEDVNLYEDYIDTIDFFSSTPEQESALYRIYVHEKEWPGLLNQIIFDINCPGVSNRFLNSEITERRINCGQSCQKNGNCQLCRRSFHLANREFLKQYTSEIDKF